MEKLHDKLNRMIDHTYIYRGRRVCISGWDQFDRHYVFYNDGQTIRLDSDNIRNELKAFRPPEEKLAAQTKLPSFLTRDNHIHQMEKVLLDNIDAIDEDPANIEKAKAIQANAKTMLDIQKFKLDIYKEMQKQGSL
jgi:hypothetical protein